MKNYINVRSDVDKYMLHVQLSLHLLGYEFHYGEVYGDELVLVENSHGFHRVGPDKRYHVNVAQNRTEEI